MLREELDAAVSLARDASRVILEYYNSDRIVAENKIGVDDRDEPVTAADRKASDIIVEGLCETFPDDAVLSEEEPDDPIKRLGRDRVWIVDPIDGTLGFIRKDGDFAVQIGLAQEGIPVLGVVLLPFHNKIYYATKGQDAFVQSGDSPPETLKVSGRTDFREIYIAVSRNHRSMITNRIKADFGLKGEVQRGSVGLKVGLIAERECDLYIHPSPRTKLWDTCGPQVILEEAGGRVTDIFGNPLHYDRLSLQNRNGILASNGSVHERTVKRLEPLLREAGRKPAHGS